MKFLRNTYKSKELRRNLNLKFTMRSIKFTIYNNIIKSIFLAISFAPLFLFAQQAVTKQGENTTSDTEFVNETGEIVRYPALTRYGEILPFCGGPFTDGRDATVYQTVLIGDQCWMAENLRYLPAVVGPATGSDTETYYYVYNYNGTDVNSAKLTANYQTYGVLYNKPAVMNGESSSNANPSGVQGVCPIGWHVPSTLEWQDLFNYLSSTPAYWCDAASWKYAKSLASTSGWLGSAISCYVGYNQASNNATGFNAKPGGGRYNTSTFSLINSRGIFWSSYGANTLELRYNSVGGLQSSSVNQNGFSIRCIRDNDCEYLSTPVTGTHITSSGQIEWHWNAVPHTTGYKYNISSDYTTATDIGNSTSFTQTGTFYCSSNYTLYVWAYSDCGLSNWGKFDVLTYACPPNPCGGVTQFTDSRDTKIYNTVEIGGQCWMKENLAYLPSVVGPGTFSYTTPYYYVYDYNGTSVPTAKATANYANYGVLYNWAAVMNGAGSSNNNPSGVQGVCPTGWHVPSQEEWRQFELFLMSNAIYWCDGWYYHISKSIANTNGWTVSTENCTPGNDQTSNNVSGFSGKPGGYTYSGFSRINNNSNWWSSTHYNSNDSWFALIMYNDPYFIFSSNPKLSGLSVRCVKD